MTQIPKQSHKNEHGKVQVLTLPGWQDSGSGHWQTLWEERRGARRVEQHDWQRPLRGDWSARLEEVVRDAPGPVVLAAHSLGAVLLVWWAAHSQVAAHKVRGALLVAPADMERPELDAQIHGWAPVASLRLPFPAIVAASRNDSFCTWQLSEQFARQWGARLVDLGACGHVNAESGLGDWSAGWDLISPFLKD